MNKITSSIIVIHHHHHQSTVIIINHLSSSSIIVIHHHHHSSIIVIFIHLVIYHHHHLSSSSIIVINIHHHHPSIIIILHHHSSIIVIFIHLVIYRHPSAYIIINIMIITRGATVELGRRNVKHTFPATVFVYQLMYDFVPRAWRCHGPADITVRILFDTCRRPASVSAFFHHSSRLQLDRDHLTKRVLHPSLAPQLSFLLFEIHALGLKTLLLFNGDLTVFSCKMANTICCLMDHAKSY